MSRPQSNKGKDKDDAELILRRKFLAKCRFRALVRKVMDNLYWLTEDEEVYEGDNVKKRVEQAMRTKSKKANLLSLSDKALLNKPVSERTEVEKRYIYRKIGALKCFKRYPNHVKRKLAAATYFKYYGPNRVVVRQNQEAHALYFVVTGEVNVSVEIYDELLKKNISIQVFVMHPGDMFGEVSLLHNIKRTATCTTSGHCEFLALMRQDFKEVLQKSLEKQWEEVTIAMNSFTYFKGLDEVARREGCIVAKMKSYEPDDTILGDGQGMTSFVYFVLSGKCQMIESLNILSKDTLGKKYYSLHDPQAKKISKESDGSKDKSSKISENDIASEIRNLSRDSKTIGFDEKSTEDIQSQHEEKQSETMVKYDVAQQSSLQLQRGSKSVDHVRTDTKTTMASSKRRSTLMVKEPSKINSNEPIELSTMLLQSQNDKLKKDSFRMKAMPIAENIRKYFMQVCIFNAGSTFGFGENMRDRRIVAMTRVDCMLLPLTWLLQKNTANIWSRIQHYLEKKIPTKQQLFQHFVQQRRWLEWRDSLVEEVVSRSKTVNHTTLHDVPYSIRMQDKLDV